MGSDWKGKFDDLEKFCSVEYLTRTEGVSTTIIKKNMGLINSSMKEALITGVTGQTSILTIFIEKGLCCSCFKTSNVSFQYGSH